MAGWRGDWALQQISPDWGLAVGEVRSGEEQDPAGSRGGTRSGGHTGDGALKGETASLAYAAFLPAARSPYGGRALRHFLRSSAKRGASGMVSETGISAH